MRLKFPIFIQKFAKKAQLKCSVRAISIAPYRTFRGPLKFLNIRVSGKQMGSNVCPEVRRALVPLNISLSYVHDVLLQVLYEIKLFEDIKGNIFHIERMWTTGKQGSYCANIKRFIRPTYTNKIQRSKKRKKILGIFFTKKKLIGRGLLRRLEKKIFKFTDFPSMPNLLNFLPDPDCFHLDALQITNKS